MTFKAGSHDPIKVARNQRNFLAGSDECGAEREQRVLNSQKSSQYQIQIVLVKRTGTEPFSFEEIGRTDPVYTANVDSSGHVDAIMAAIMAAIERYARSL